MRVSTETIAEIIADYIRLVEEHGPMTAAQIAGVAESNPNQRAVERTRYRLEKAVKTGAMIYANRDVRWSGQQFAVNPDKTVRLAAAYTVQEQLAHAIEDAIVDVLAREGWMPPREIAVAIGAFRKPDQRSTTRQLTAESADRYCSDLVERGVLLREGPGYVVKGAR